MQYLDALPEIYVKCLSICKGECFACFRIENLSEGDCLIEGLNYMMKNTPQTELVYPVYFDDETKIVTEMKAMLEMYAKLEADSKHKVGEYFVDLSVYTK